MSDMWCAHDDTDGSGRDDLRQSRTAFITWQQAYAARVRDEAGPRNDEGRER